MKWWRSIVVMYHNVFNIKFALISAVFQGCVAMWVNRTYGPETFVMAGLTQAATSFLSTGVTARVIQHFSPIPSVLISYTLGSLVPTTMTFVMSFSAHLFNGTPEVLKSCITPTLVSFGTSFITNHLTRHGRLLPGNYRRTHE